MMPNGLAFLKVLPIRLTRLSTFLKYFLKTRMSELVLLKQLSGLVRLHRVFVRLQWATRSISIQPNGPVSSVAVHFLSLSHGFFLLIHLLVHALNVMGSGLF